jgi:glycosyltransferase involved in cell wall biosynthesis
MKLIVATSFASLANISACRFADWLVRRLEFAGHEAELLQIPLTENPDDVLQQFLASRLLDLSQHGDRLIALRAPGHLLRHPKKIVWFSHHCRSAHDLYGLEYQSIAESSEGIARRRAILSADNVALREASRLFCSSKTLRDRLARFNGVDAEVLYPPLFSHASFHTNGPGEYLLYFGRLTRHKRQWLAIESLRFTKHAVKLVIAGCPERGGDYYVDELCGMVARYRLEDRVSIIPRWIQEGEKAELFAKCLAVVHLPFHEDSGGYIPLEAYAARKALLTTTDAGGTCELIADGVSGIIMRPDPEQIAQAMDRLQADRSAAALMGEAGASRIADLGISWDHVVARLLS